MTTFDRIFLIVATGLSATISLSVIRAIIGWLAG